MSDPSVPPRIGEPVQLHIRRNRLKVSIYAALITQVFEKGLVTLVYWNGHEWRDFSLVPHLPLGSLEMTRWWTRP